MNERENTLTPEADVLRCLEQPLTAAQTTAIDELLRTGLTHPRNTRAQLPSLDETQTDATVVLSVRTAEAPLCCIATNHGRTLLDRLHRALDLARAKPTVSRHLRTQSQLRVQLSLATRSRTLSIDEAARHLEFGTHGVGVVTSDQTRSSFSLPEAIFDSDVDAEGFVSGVWRNAGSPRHARVQLFEVSRHVAPSTQSTTPERAAIEWLTHCASSNGSFQLRFDARTGSALRHDSPSAPTGDGRLRADPPSRVVSARDEHMYFGRWALTLRALRDAQQDRTWLTDQLAELDRQIAPRYACSPQYWTAAPHVALGTLALAALAGLNTRNALAAGVEQVAPARITPWHAAQVALALGASTPPSLWESCRRDLDRSAFAPWTLLAALDRSDLDTAERIRRCFVEAARSNPPYDGGIPCVDLPQLDSGVPQVALTACALEGLCQFDDPASRDLCRRVETFLWGNQLKHTSAAYFAPNLHGAFLASPRRPVVQADTTAHALSALVAAEKARDRMKGGSH